VKEGPTEDGTFIGDACVIDETLDPDTSLNTTHCTVLYNCNTADNGLEALDSLSVFIETDGGSFEGMSACAIVRPLAECSSP